MDGVTRFRTVEDLMRTDVDLGKAFESALKELETRKSECELIDKRYCVTIFDPDVMICSKPNVAFPRGAPRRRFTSRNSKNWKIK